MTISDAQFHAWLSDPSALRTTLIEVVANVAGTETTRYLSTRPYVTGPADTPANQLYQPIASTGVQFTEQLSLDADGSLSAGDIEIHNFNGERDAWLNDIWDNRQVQAFIGDARWARADFRMIFNGMVATIAVSSRDKLNLKIRDKLQQLNTPLTETLLGGTTPNKASLLPLLFGEAHNIAPLLADPTTLEYQVHSGVVENIFEVRDNGLPVSVTLDNANGKFRLNQSSFGAVTVSAQGDKGGGTYRNTISSLVQRIVTGYGKASQRFTSGDLDAANLAAFETAHPDPVGVYFPDRTNVLVACQMLASSIGAQLVMSRLGQLRLLQVTLPAVGTPTVILPKQMVERSLTVQSRTPVQAAVTLGFCKNWTVQSDLVTTVPQQVKDLYAQEWLQSLKVDTAVQATYRQDAAPVQKDTMLLRRTEADAEATRLSNLWKVQRTVYQFEGTADLLDTLVLGQAVTIFNHRYGLQAGATGLVISLGPNWLTARVIVQVLV
jgi:hypothetical protein